MRTLLLAVLCAHAGAIGRRRIQQALLRWLPTPPQRSSSLSAFVVCGGASAEDGGDLFDEAAPPPVSEADAATARFEAAAKAARDAGGGGPALEAFEVAIAKDDADRKESTLVGLWMDVKLESLLKSNATAAAAPFDGSSPFGRGIFFLSTECGAYVEAGKIEAEGHAAFNEKCAAACGLEVEAFNEAHERFEKAMAEDVFTLSQKRADVLAKVLDDADFAKKSVAALTASKSKVLEHLGDDAAEQEARIESLRAEMRAGLAEATAAGDKLAEAALVAKLTPAVETLSGEQLVYK
jgi:hypothetical protein